MAASKTVQNGPINSKIKIIICDDHIAIRTGLRGMLEAAQFKVVADCDSVPGLVSAVSKFPDAIVITDLNIGGMAFQDMVSEIHQQSKECPIVAYSMRETPTTIGMC